MPCSLAIDGIARYFLDSYSAIVLSVNIYEVSALCEEVSLLLHALHFMQTSLHFFIQNILQCTKSINYVIHALYIMQISMNVNIYLIMPFVQNRSICTFHILL